MNVNDLKVPIAGVIACIGVTYGLYEKYATKEWVKAVQAPIVEAIPQLTEAVQQNTKNSTRALSLDIAEDLSMMYNRLCYEDLSGETQRRALEVIDRWEVEYKALTGRSYEPGECAR